MEITVPISPEVSQLAITLVEELTQDAICSLAPKMIEALEKDKSATNPVTHPFKHEFFVLAIDLVKSMQTLAACPVATT